MNSSEQIEDLNDSIWSSIKFAIYFEGNGSVPDLLFKYFKKMVCGKTSKECPVCFLKFEVGVCMVITPCKHFFHELCLKG